MQQTAYIALNKRIQSDIGDTPPLSFAQFRASSPFPPLHRTPLIFPSLPLTFSFPYPSCHHPLACWGQVVACPPWPPNSTCVALDRMRRVVKIRVLRCLVAVFALDNANCRWRDLSQE